MRTYSVRHSTRYEYELPVMHAHHLTHLRPRALENQLVHASSVQVSPKPRSHSQRRDYFGNECDSVEVMETHDVLDVTCTSIVSVKDYPLASLAPQDSPTWEEVRRLLRTDDRYLSEREFCFDSPLVRVHRLLQEYAAPIFAAGRSLVGSVTELNKRIFDDFEYDPVATDISTPLGQVMRERRGVCQDFAHVAIGCLRSLGLAARYVSGYLETIPPPGEKRLVGADASHAWASVYIPDVGWFDFDPTNALLPKSRHITAAWGRDFSDVCPLKGVVVGGGGHILSVGVDVEPRDSWEELLAASGRVVAKV